MVLTPGGTGEAGETLPGTQDSPQEPDRDETPLSGEGPEDEETVSPIQREEKEEIHLEENSEEAEGIAAHNPPQRSSLLTLFNVSFL